MEPKNSGVRIIEFIEKLQEIYTKEGNLFVVLQYRNGGEAYNPILEIKNGINSETNEPEKAIVIC